MTFCSVLVHKVKCCDFHFFRLDLDLQRKTIRHEKICFKKKNLIKIPLNHQMLMFHLLDLKHYQDPSEYPRKKEIVWKDFELQRYTACLHIKKKPTSSILRMGFGK